MYGILWYISTYINKFHFNINTNIYSNQKYDEYICIMTVECMHFSLLPQSYSYFCTLTIQMRMVNTDSYVHNWQELSHQSQKKSYCDSWNERVVVNFFQQNLRNILSYTQIKDPLENHCEVTTWTLPRNYLWKQRFATGSKHPQTCENKDSI